MRQRGAASEEVKPGCDHSGSSSETFNSSPGRWDQELKEGDKKLKVIYTCLQRKPQAAELTVHAVICKNSLGEKTFFLSVGESVGWMVFGPD